MTMEQLITISPVTNKPLLFRNALPPAEIALLPRQAERAFEFYRRTPLKHRQEIVAKALELLDGQQETLAKELTEQIGRPIKFARKEIATAVVRGRYLLKISEEPLRDTPGEQEKGFKRYIRKVPVGPVLILFAWNVSAHVLKISTIYR